MTNVQRWPQDPYFLFHPLFYTSLRCGSLKESYFSPLIPSSTLVKGVEVWNSLTKAG